jgi:hypothetical protein
VNESDWYLLDRGGRRHGPYDLDFVRQLAAQHELAGDTPVWHPGLARWQPAARVLTLPAQRARHVETPAPAPVAAPERKVAAAARPATAARPAARAARPTAPGAAVPRVTPLTPAQLWQRVLAGAFDLLLVAIALRAVARFAPMELPWWLGTPPAALLAWAVLDGWLLAQLGTTPGKALMGVTIRGQGGTRLDERRAWMRSAAVPLALLLFSVSPVLGFFALVAIGAGLLRLRAGFPAWWDQLAGSTVSVAELGQGRRALAALMLGLALLVAVVLRRLPQLVTT